jgi:hypothetical protein
MMFVAVCSDGPPMRLGRHRWRVAALQPKEQLREQRSTPLLATVWALT